MRFDEEGQRKLPFFIARLPCGASCESIEKCVEFHVVSKLFKPDFPLYNPDKM